jgi:hypothetical protein
LQIRILIGTPPHVPVAGIRVVPARREDVNSKTI